MIDIKCKEQCCGCKACEQTCPTACITMQSDGEGFLYPKVDLDNCIHCGACQSVCPVLRPAPRREPYKTYAAKSRDEQVRALSSSGGLFMLLAAWTLEQGGVVYGACFDAQWRVVHSSAERLDEVAKFCGSKYVQSDIGDSYATAKRHLDSGRQVLFSGTPCQIAALKLYLSCEYSNLLTSDVICHGVPSPMVWRRYLDEVSEGSKIKNVNFRDKSTGWGSAQFVVESERRTIRERSFSCPFVKGFLMGLYERPSCHACPTRGLSSGSDITLGDFWGVERQLPEWDDNRGVGLVFIHTERMEKLLHSLNVELQECDFHTSIKENGAVLHSTKISSRRAKFFKNMDRGIIAAIAKYSRRSRISKLIYRVKNLI